MPATWAGIPHNGFSVSKADYRGISSVVRPLFHHCTSMLCGTCCARSLAWSASVKLVLTGSSSILEHHSEPYFLRDAAAPDYTAFTCLQAHIPGQQRQASVGQALGPPHRRPERPLGKAAAFHAAGPAALLRGDRRVLLHQVRALDFFVISCEILRGLLCHLATA